MGFETTEREVTRSEVDDIESRLATVESGSGGVIGKPVKFMDNVSTFFDGTDDTTPYYIPTSIISSPRLKVSVIRDSSDPADVVRLKLTQDSGGTLYFTGFQNGGYKSNATSFGVNMTSFGADMQHITKGTFRNDNAIRAIDIEVVCARGYISAWATLRWVE